MATKEELVILKQIKGRPKSDFLKIGVFEDEKDYFYLIIRGSDGEYSEESSEVTIRLKKSVLEELLGVLKSGNGAVLNGEPITKRDFEYKRSGIEGLISNDKLEIKPVKKGFFWYFDLGLTKISRHHAQIRIGKWTLIIGITQALKQR